MQGRVGFVRTQWTDADHDFKQLITYFQFNLENMAIEYLQKYRAQYGREALLGRCENLRLLVCTLQGEIEVFGNPLMFACYKNSAALVHELLTSGMTLNTLTESTDLSWSGWSPLALAAYQGNTGTIKVLLKAGADVLFRTEPGKALITFAATADIADLILQEAYARNMLDELLRQRCYRGEFDIWQFCCLLGNADALSRLVRIPNLGKYTNISKLARYARSSPLNYPSKYLKFKAVAAFLEKLPRTAVKARRVPEVDLHSTVNADDEVPNAYHHLFGVHLDPALPRTREEALKLANAKYLALLASPHQCLKYLQFLNKEFERYYATKHNGAAFPAADARQFEFREIDSTYYPIPTRDSAYKKHNRNEPYHKKHSALQEFLLLMLRKHDMGKRAIKWVGFVPRNIANAQVAEGDMVLEGKYNLVSILHCVTPHVLQLAMMICMVEAGDIRMDYIENDEVRQLTVKELNASQVMFVAQNPDGSGIFTEIRDKRIYSRVSFSDPHRLISFIMHSGASHGLLALSDSLTDSFCKSVWKFFLHAKTLISGLTDFEEFAMMLSGLPSGIFFNNEIYNLQAAQKYEAMPDKYKVHRDPSGRLAFLTVDVNYQPARHFELRAYSSPQVDEVRESAQTRVSGFSCSVC